MTRLNDRTAVVVYFESRGHRCRLSRGRYAHWKNSEYDAQADCTARDVKGVVLTATTPLTNAMLVNNYSDDHDLLIRPLPLPLHCIGGIIRLVVRVTGKPNEVQLPNAVV